MRFNPRSLSVQGTLDNNPPNDLKEGLRRWYSGGGFPIELLKKYYGYGQSLSINPTQEQLRKSFFSDYTA